MKCSLVSPVNILRPSVWIHVFLIMTDRENLTTALSQDVLIRFLKDTPWYLQKASRFKRL